MNKLRRNKDSLRFVVLVDFYMIILYYFSWGHYDLQYPFSYWSKLKKLRMSTTNPKPLQVYYWLYKQRLPINYKLYMFTIYEILLHNLLYVWNKYINTV